MADGRVSFSVEAVVRGYHAYKHIWAAVYGEELPCEREAGNRVDAFAVAVMKDGTVVGHVPKKISSVCSLYLRRGGSIICHVTCTKRTCEKCSRVQNFRCSNFRGFYFRISVVGRENRENLDLAKISRYTVLLIKRMLLSWFCTWIITAIPQ